MRVGRYRRCLAAVLFPFVLPWDDSAYTPVSLSELSAAPAGAQGHVQSREGHLYVGNRRIRFVGMNFTFSAALPASRSDAVAIASRLAKYGVNAVRLIPLDARPFPDGLLNADRRTLNADALARFDWFVHSLQQRGIYIALPLHVGRRLPIAGDERSEEPPAYNGLEFFDAEAIRLQQEYARTLLWHRNPHTGLRYANDPGIAFVEIANENGLVINWWRGRFESWPTAALTHLTQRWNDWLRLRYGNEEALQRHWTASTGREGEVLARGWEGWHLQQSDGGRASAVLEREGDVSIAQLRVMDAGAKSHSIQWRYDGLPAMDAGYRVEFEARVDGRCKIVIAVERAAPYKLLDRRVVELGGGGWRHYAMIFTPLSSTSPSRLTLTNLSTCGKGLALRSFTLARGGAVGLSPDERLGGVRILARDGFDARSVAAQRDWLRFVTELERQYYTDMRRFLRDELGVNSLLVGTQQNYSPPVALKDMDVVDMHGYWDTQIRVGDGVYQMHNRSQIGDSQAGVLGAVAPYRVEGKPFIVSEYNYRGANTYAAEADLLMLAYASLHDWDGVFIFNYANNDRFAVDRMIGDEGFNGHTNRFVALLPAALMFRRGDLRPSQVSIVTCVTPMDLYEHMRKHGPSPSAVHYGIPVREVLRHRLSLRLSNNGCPPAGKSVPGPERMTRSDTGEIIWRSTPGRPGALTFDSPAAKAVIGPTPWRDARLGPFRVSLGETVQGWAAVSLTALEPPRGPSGRWLLVATGMSRNTGMRFLDAARTRYRWGRGPVLVEGVPLTLQFPVAAARGVRVHALDETGAPQAVVPVEYDGGSARVDLGPARRTVWYLIEIPDASP